MMNTLKYTFIGFLVIVATVTVAYVLGSFFKSRGELEILAAVTLLLSFAVGDIIKELNKP